MNALNRVIMIGRLTGDPEIRFTTNEIPVANFSIAVNRTVGKEKRKEVDFFQIVAWSGLAKICGEYLKKGKLIAVEGRLEVQKYEDKAGVKRTNTKIVADNIQMLDRKSYGEKAKEGKEASENDGSGAEDINEISW